jgi:hypothetical protein
VLIPFSPNIEAIYVLRLLQGLAGGLIAMTGCTVGLDDRHWIGGRFNRRLVMSSPGR